MVDNEKNEGAATSAPALGALSFGGSAFGANDMEASGTTAVSDSAPQDKSEKHAEHDADESEKTKSKSDDGDKTKEKSKDDKSKSKDKGDKKEKSKGDDKQEKEPAGGFDSTPIPHAPPGYTIKITFHRATHLPMADINSLSSDPYVLAQLNTNLPQRHKEDPLLRFRTPTIRRSVDPEWNTEWIVANVPASGFKLKARIYDEDPADHDDRLGNVHVNVGRIDEHWEGIREQSYKIRKRMGSKRAYLIRLVASCFRLTKHLNGRLIVSVEVLGRTEGESGGRAYTVGPQWWTMHYSPLLGRIANRKEPGKDENGQKKKAERYNFQANQIQLEGPVPEELYHRYVEFKPFVKGMFTSSGIRGMILSKALHHQHNRVYNFDRSTKYGIFPSQEDVTRKFLDLVHYDQGGRVFTYVLTLDALWRFTETGKEFGIDMLSKHTMHSDVSIYIAFSGEFFVRRLKHANRAPPEEGGNNKTHPPNDISGGPPDDDPPKDPAHYELIIDNDSGTYRPNADMLPVLKRYLEAQLPGLKVETLDCQKDADKMAKMKKEQREKKQTEGDQIVYYQANDSDSISSSDEEALDELEHGTHSERGMLKQFGHGIGHSNSTRLNKWRNTARGRIDEDGDGVEDEPLTSNAAGSGTAEKKTEASGATKEEKAQKAPAKAE